jgi:hypothetical protein
MTLHSGSLGQLHQGRHLTVGLKISFLLVAVIVSSKKKKKKNLSQVAVLQKFSFRLSFAVDSRYTITFRD